MKFFYILTIFFFLLMPIIWGQQNYRIKADFTIKEKLYDGKERLTMGQVFYDKTEKKLIYDIKFPEKETWVIIDTMLYRIINKKVIEVKPVKAIAEFSIFHLILNEGIADFGLKKSFYTIDKVEKENNMIITTWHAPEKLSKTFGKIVLAQKNKQLNGVVFFSPIDVILTKQFFKKYINVNGVQFPTEIIQISYVNKQENYQLTTYKNIIIDDFKENNIYNYNLPK